MCGGIAGMLHAQVPNGRGGLVFGFHGGRLASYLLIALLATLIGLLPTQVLPNLAPMIMRGLLGAVMISMAFYIAMPGKFKDRLGAWMAPMAQGLMPLFGRFLPVTTFDRATGLGMLWGLLPCGLLYTMVASAVLLADPIATVSMIIAFGLGTTPALLGTGLIGLKARSTANRKDLRWLAAIFMFLAGVLVALGPMLVHWIDHPWMHFLADCVAPR